MHDREEVKLGCAKCESGVEKVVALESERLGFNFQFQTRMTWMNFFCISEQQAIHPQHGNTCLEEQ